MYYSSTSNCLLFKKFFFKVQLQYRYYWFSFILLVLVIVIILILVLVFVIHIFSVGFHNIFVHVLDAPPRTTNFTLLQLKAGYLTRTTRGLVLLCLCRNTAEKFHQCEEFQQLQVVFFTLIIFNAPGVQVDLHRRRFQFHYTTMKEFLNTLL